MEVETVKFECLNFNRVLPLLTFPSELVNEHLSNSFMMKLAVIITNKQEMLIINGLRR
jgi:hypothetical protein